MHTPFEFQDEGSRIVYVKAVEVSDLPDDVRQQVGDVDHLYAVHDSAGQQLALVADRKMAFVLARQHDYEPVTVH